MNIQPKKASKNAAAPAGRRLWRSALDAVFGPAQRLHHYRDVHTRMIREALCQLECRQSRSSCADE